jgi:protein required for attachment to host cells
MCIAVVDAARARLYTFDQESGPHGSRTQELREETELIDPDRRNRSSTGELERRFAAEVIDRISDLVRDHGCHRLIVVASPNLLEELRKLRGPRFAGHLAIDELGRDATHFSPAQIHDLLAEQGLLPARERIAS